MKNYYIYILASRHNKALYIGVTSNLIKRIWEHKNNLFTPKYNVHKLVYFEEFQDVDSALNREKLFKSWKREWKVDLVARKNPNWYNLYYEITK